MVTWIVTGLIVWAAIAVATFALLSAAGRADRVRERRAAQQRLADAAAVEEPAEEAESRPRFRHGPEHGEPVRSGEASRPPRR